MLNENQDEEMLGRAKKSSLFVLSLLFGIFSILTFLNPIVSISFGLLGIIFGIIGAKQFHKKIFLTRIGMNVIGILLSCNFLALTLLFHVIEYRSLREYTNPTYSIWYDSNWVVEEGDNLYDTRYLYQGNLDKSLMLMACQKVDIAWYLKNKTGREMLYSSFYSALSSSAKAQGITLKETNKFVPLHSSHMYLADIEYENTIYDLQGDIYLLYSDKTDHVFFFMSISSEKDEQMKQETLKIFEKMKVK